MHHRPSVFKACVFLFAASASLASIVQAADSKLDNVLKRGHLIVGTGSTNAPWHFQGADGKLQGFDIDIARIVAKGLFNDPSKVEFVVQSSDARIPNLLTDKVDMSCQFITVTASRAQQVAFTLPYYREGVGLLLPNNSKYKEIEDLQAAGDSVTVAVLQNVYAEELVHQALPKAKVDQYDSVDLMYQAVNSGRADAAAKGDNHIAAFDFLFQQPFDRTGKLLPSFRTFARRNGQRRHHDAFLLQRFGKIHQVTRGDRIVGNHRDLFAAQ